MEKQNWRRQWRWLLWLSAMVGLVFLFFLLDGDSDKMKTTSVIR